MVCKNPRTNYLSSQIQLLRNTLLDVEKHIQPGVMRFNWNSLNISDYAHDCEKLLKNLNSIVDQVNHMKSDLDNRINNDLQSYNLFSLPLRICNSEELLPCKVFSYISFHLFFKSSPQNFIHRARYSSRHETLCHSSYK